MKLIGANASAAVTGADELPGKSNYFIGNDPKKWRTNVPNFAKVKYQDVYPGVDLVYYGNQGGQLEYDFVVAPGADPTAIRLALSGGLEVGSRQSAVGRGSQNQRAPQSKIQNLKSKIDADGDLLILTDGGEVRFHKPVVYQEQFTVDSSQLIVQDEKRRTTGNPKSKIQNRKFLEGHYTLDAQNHVQFQVAPYDHSKTLFIDPTLWYSTYLGGSGGDTAFGIAVDSFGNAYVAGETHSANFPLANPLQATNDASDIAFVAKFNVAGSGLVYSTYLGGSTLDAASSIAVDSPGNAYVTGFSASVDFPTVNPFQAINHSNGNAFVAKLNAAGSALVYSTFLGGSGNAHGEGDTGNGIAVDSHGSAYVTGRTFSTDFPTANAFQTTCGNCSTFASNAFVTKFNAAGSALVYSTYLGGSGGTTVASYFGDSGNAIAVDSSGNAYVTGQAESIDFPVIGNAYQASNNAGIYGTAFVTKLFSAGSFLVFSTYLGGSVLDRGYGIAVDSSENVYVTGYTASPDFPTVIPLQANYNAGVHGTAFVTKLYSQGSFLIYSTFLGGSNEDYGQGIAVDSSGNTFVTGAAESTDFPITGNAYQATNHGGYDAFVAEINAVGFPLVYSTYLGGSGDAMGQGIALDSFGNAYLAGSTYSTDFPTANPAQANNHGASDAFVAKFSTGGPALVLLPGSPLGFYAQNVDTTSLPVIETLTNPGGASLSISSIVASGGFAQTNTCRDSVPAGGRCTISITFTPTTTGANTGLITITDNAPRSPQTVALSGLGVLPVVFSPTSLSFGNQAENTTSPPQTVTLANTQSTPLAMSITTSPYFGQTNTCGGSVPAMSRCTISVTFTPSILGVEAGTLTVLNANGSLLQTVTLTGRGVLQAALSTPSVSFVAQTVGNTSPPWSVLLGNNLTTALPISITFTGADPSDFAQTNACNGSVAARSSCTISVTFTPTATGKRTATMNINDSANNSPQTLALTGTGQ